MGTSGLWFNLDEALIGMIQIQESQLVSSCQYRCSYKKNLIDFEAVIAMGYLFYLNLLTLLLSKSSFWHNPGP